MKHLLQLIKLGRMTEKILLDGKGVHLDRSYQVPALSIDEVLYPMTSEQAKLVTHLLAVGKVHRWHEEEQR